MCKNCIIVHKIIILDFKTVPPQCHIIEDDSVISLEVNFAFEKIIILRSSKTLGSLKTTSTCWFTPISPEQLPHPLKWCQGSLRPQDFSDPKILTPGLASPGIQDISLKAWSTLPQDSKQTQRSLTLPWKRLQAKGHLMLLLTAWAVSCTILWHQSFEIHDSSNLQKDNMVYIPYAYNTEKWSGVTFYSKLLKFPLKCTNTHYPTTSYQRTAQFCLKMSCENILIFRAFWIWELEIGGSVDRSLPLLSPCIRLVICWLKIHQCLPLKNSKQNHKEFPLFISFYSIIW